jgi:hypothetical protein
VIDRIQNLVQSGRLAVEPAADDEIAGLWANAVQAFDDARIERMSANGRLVRAYDSGRIAATALVRSRDLRVRAANHHEVTLSVAVLLSEESLAEPIRELDGLRRLRTGLEYGWQAGASAADVDRALDAVGRILRHGAGNLREHRPAMADRIAAPA